MAWYRIPRQIFRLHHVESHVAVHEPMAWTLWNPRHVKSSARKHFLRHDRRLLLRCELLEMRLIADAADLKIEPVQVHGVIGIARVNPTPANGRANLEAEAFGVRPRFPVDGGKSIEGVAANGNPGIHDKYAVVIACAGRIDHERAGEHGIR